MNLRNQIMFFKSISMAYVILIGALCVMFFYKIIFFHEIYFMGDTLLTNYPQRVYVARYIKSHFSLPLWAPEMMGGYPLFAESQTGMLYPPNVLYLLFDGPEAFILLAVLHCFMAGAFMFLFVRSLTMDSMAAFLSGIVFSFSGFFVAHLHHVSLVNAMAWMPLVFYFFEKGRRNVNGFYFSGIALGIQILASHPQIPFLTMLLLSFYAFFTVASAGEWKCLRGFACLLLTGFGVSAVQMIPLAELFMQSVRGPGLSFHDAAYFSMPLSRLPSLFVFYSPPETQFFFAGDPLWEMCAYVGILPAGLSLLSLTKFREKKESVLFFSVLLLGLYLSLGEHSWLYRALFHLPLLRSFQSPTRFMLFFTFSCAILSGMGYGVLRQSISQRHAGNGLRAVVLSIPFLIFFDLFLFGKNYNRTAPVSQFLLPPRVASFFQQDKNLYRVAVFPERFMKRLLFEDRMGRLSPLEFKESLPPNSNLLYGTHSFHGYTPLLLSRYAAMMKSAISENILDMLNVKYVIAGQMNHKNYEKVLMLNPDLIVYRRKFPLKRAYLVSEYRIVRTEEEMIGLLRNTTFHPQREVLLEEQPQFEREGPSLDVPRGDDVDIVKYAHHDVVIRAECGAPCFLVLGDVYYPGWRVTVNGKKSKIYRANYILRAVALPEGRHEVRFTFRPASVMTGAAVTLLTVLCLCGIFLRHLLMLTRPAQKF